MIQRLSMHSRLPAFETKPPCFVFFSASDASSQHLRSKPQDRLVALEDNYISYTSGAFYKPRFVTMIRFGSDPIILLESNSAGSISQ